MTRLALTMIVRDEAAQLPDFFAHHAGLADEVVVVDTGSRDGTVRLCREAGATVVTRAWDEDFAAARNAGLAAVAADWIVFLDADERISRADFATLRKALPAGPDRVFLQETWNYCPEASHLEWRPLPGRYPVEEAGQGGLFVARRVGLFPRLPQLRFSGRVHESVLPAAGRLGLAVRELAVPVHHYGYVRSAAVNAARRDRYRALTDRKLAETPDDPAARLEWAAVRLEDGDTAAATAALARLAAGPPGLRPVVRAQVLLGRLARERGDLPAARNLLREAIGQDPGFLFGWLEALRTEIAAEAWPDASSLLVRAEARFGTGDPLLLREAVRVRINTRELPAALRAATELARIQPQWTDMRDLAVRLAKMCKPAEGA